MLQYHYKLVEAFIIGGINMKINHVAIYVNNLEKTKEFYEKFYGYELNGDEVKNILNPKSNF